MTVAPPPYGAIPERGERMAGDLSAGLGDTQAQGRGPGNQPADALKTARFEGMLASASKRRVADDEDNPNALPIAVPTVPLVQVLPGEIPRAPDLPAPRAAEIVALVDKLGIEIRAAATALPTSRGEGFALRLDLGSSVLGVQSMTLHFGPGTLVLALALGPGGGVHDLPLAVQALAAALAHRHPGRAIRIEEETRRADGDEPGPLGVTFDPLRPAKAHST